jgi:Lon-like protease
MVTPTDPDAHGAGPMSNGADDDGAVVSASTAIEPATDGASHALEAAPPAPPPRRRRRTGRIVTAVAVCLLAAFVAGAAFVPLPYYLFKPGSVRDTQPLLAVDGTEVYESEGSIGYTTVAVRQATLLGLAQGWLDDDIDVYDRERVLGDRDPDENRQFNLQMMSDAKQVATLVALERLGYDVDVTVGQIVADVMAGMPAEGLLEVGDTITAIDGETFEDAADLGRLLEDAEPGDSIVVTVRSPSIGNERDVDITLAASPDDPDKGIMGIEVRPRVIDYEFPIEVEIDTGDVGGPSAGLAFALAIIDDLTPGELTGGSEVAVTGTIAPDGTVGAVGGTGQKAAAVRDRGIELFLVPRADYEAAASRAGDDLTVVPVDTIDDALEALGDRGGNVDDLPAVGEAAAAAP